LSRSFLCPSSLLCCFFCCPQFSFHPHCPLLSRCYLITLRNPCTLLLYITSLVILPVSLFTLFFRVVLLSSQFSCLTTPAATLPPYIGSRLNVVFSPPFFFTPLSLFGALAPPPPFNSFVDKSPFSFSSHSYSSVEPHLSLLSVTQRLAPVLFFCRFCPFDYLGSPFLPAPRLPYSGIFPSPLFFL